MYEDELRPQHAKLEASDRLVREWREAAGSRHFSPADGAQRLPMFKYRTAFLESVADHQVTIVSGHTGGRLSFTGKGRVPLPLWLIPPTVQNRTHKHALHVRITGGGDFVRRQVRVENFVLEVGVDLPQFLALVHPPWRR